MDLERMERYIVRQKNDCWIWTGGTTGNGYGKCAHRDRTMGAHVVSFLLHGGKLEEGKIVRHICGVKLCVNPAHLASGTYSENEQDKKLKGIKLGREEIYSDATLATAYKLRLSGKTSKQISDTINVPDAYLRSFFASHQRQTLLSELEKVYGALPRAETFYKFSAEDIETIRSLRKQGVSAAKLAILYDTNYKYIWKICVGKARPLTTRGDI